MHTPIARAALAALVAALVAAALLAGCGDLSGPTPLAVGTPGPSTFRTPPATQPALQLQAGPTAAIAGTMSPAQGVRP